MIILKLITSFLLTVIPIVILIRDWKFHDKRTKRHHNITRTILVLWFIGSIGAVIISWTDSVQIDELISGKDIIIAQNLEALKGIDRQIILGSTIEWIRIRVNFKGVDDYEKSQLYFWFFKTNVFDIKMFLDLPGTFDKENFPIRAKNVNPENYLLFDSWIAHKTDINDKDVYHKLVTHGFKKSKFVIGQLYVEPSNQLRRLSIRDFHKSYFKILVNEKAKNNLQRIDLILNDSIIFKVSLDGCIIEELKKFEDYPDKLNKKSIYSDKWFLIGIGALHTIGTGPFEINLY